MFCNQCGRQISDDSRFCNYCGANLTTVRPVPQPAAVQSNPYFDIRHGVLVKYKGREKNVVVPAGVVEIEKDAFTGYDMESITIPEGCRKVSINTFVKTIRFPSTVEFFSLNGKKYGQKPADALYFSSGIKEIIGKVSWCSYGEETAFIAIQIPQTVTKLDINTYSSYLRFSVMKMGEINKYHPAVRKAIWRHSDLCENCGGTLRMNMWGTRKCTSCGKNAENVYFGCLRTE